MTTTQSDIRQWLTKAREAGASHMLVVCDTFDHTDYPVEVMPTDNLKAMMERNSGPNMTRLMEVYDLNMDLEGQLAERRAWHIGEASR